MSVTHYRSLDTNLGPPLALLSDFILSYLADPEEGSRRYHIHLTYPSSKEWNELIGFRDYLRAHPEAAEEYANIPFVAEEFA